MANLNLNKVVLAGRLTADPELKQTQSGLPVLSFTLAINRRFQKTADGQPAQQQADFINCVAWRQTAEFAAKYLAKGRKVAVEGSLQTRSYDAQDGSKRYVTEVIADNVEICDSRKEGAQSDGLQNGGFTEVDDDELPF